ncbi:MAG: hypothetical protein LKJ25_06005 [Clostridia bacterium]|jgi:hypothetical protein|nr:hypothetical protein [Clostridia bacterium]
MKAFVLNRDRYKQVKKMDHSQMSEFCQGLCTKAYKTGITDGAAGIIYAVKEGKIKGIGKATAKKIEAYLSEEGQQ